MQCWTLRSCTSQLGPSASSCQGTFFATRAHGSGVPKISPELPEKKPAKVPKIHNYIIPVVEGTVGESSAEVLANCSAHSDTRFDSGSCRSTLAFAVPHAPDASSAEHFDIASEGTLEEDRANLRIDEPKFHIEAQTATVPHVGFTVKYTEWQDTLRRWKETQQAWKARSKAKGVADYANGGATEPLFSSFCFEDWAFLSIRVELHLIILAVRSVMDDPARPTFPLVHLSFYYYKLFKKQFIILNYGLNEFSELVNIIKDTVGIKGECLEPQLHENIDFGKYSGSPP